jgi:hypothetical protein
MNYSMHKDLIWNKFVHLKVFAWRFLNDKLPTKDNLAWHSYLHLDSILCLVDCGMIENSNNPFVICDFVELVEQYG